MTPDKKTEIKKVIMRLHEGAHPDEVKKQFAEVIRGVSAVEVAQAEEELIRDGMPREEVQRLCEVHLSVLRQSLDSQRQVAPEGHPIRTLMDEHSILLGAAADLKSLTGAISNGDLKPSAEITARIRLLIRHFKESASHYLREENVLFPLLEKHGITEPPKVMWMEHDQIRATEKSLYETVPEVDAEIPARAGSMSAAASALYDLLNSHFYKENNILFPTSLKLFTAEEWTLVSREFEDVGYSFFSPKRGQSARPGDAMAAVSEGTVVFESGSLPVQVLQAMLNTLPVDITFVDHEDKVRYFSESPERVFVRSRAVIGRSVQACHPQKSVHVVNRILQDFREGKRNVAEFWIHLQERFIHIRYFAVRDKAGKYLGCLEVSQDIAPIKKIEGEKRLLDDVPT
ncbi:MAG: DUF438 domain-containing protein [Candidatus Thorarchaeota archaeon]|nr:DUF438 domain-containing protein [Candidatus Thorarchaeota archaeon]